MNVEQIKELISIVEKSNITSFELEESGYRIRIGKDDVTRSRQHNFYDPMIQSSGSTQLSSDQSRSIQSGNSTNTGLERVSENGAGIVDTSALDKSEKKNETGWSEIKSPMLGVYYTAPAPDAEVFVKVGDRVKKGQVLCIIEAMKLMNEILAEKEGEVAEICVENGQIVEFAQVMFKLK